VRQPRRCGRRHRGRPARALETENADLLWGLRGGGGNFGIVTQFELQLHPLGPLVYAGPIFYPADADRDLLRAFRDWSESAPDEITALVNLTTAPPLPVIPTEWHGKKVAAFVAVSAGPVDEGESLVREFCSVAEPIADLLGPMQYHVIQTLLDPLWVKGINAYFKATNLSRLDDGLIDRLSQVHLAAPGPQCEIHIHQMGGAVGRVPDGNTAFAERSMPFVLNAVTGWHDDDAEVGEAHRDWAREGIDTASDASTGRVYVNFLGDTDAARSSYGDETYARLVALKNAYDPTNCSGSTRTSSRTPNRARERVQRASSGSCAQGRFSPNALRQLTAACLMGRAGIEPATLGLKVPCSTN
jgi:hypothetical protein